eukprot:Sspe_Gene.7855::Locus_2666_Transcript_1_3_Confidence_0.500_Length_1486::g.7855::m.7855
MWRQIVRPAGVVLCGVLASGLRRADDAGQQWQHGPLVAWGKPKDTPDYLMPYYLTTLRRRFNHYSSEMKDGKRMMTTDDFIRSLVCAKKPNIPIPPNVSRDLDNLFRTADANSDGLLSFSEYSLFMIFLTHSKHDFELAFKMFDENESGTVDVEEFKQICLCLNRDPTVRLNFKGGVTKLFFGNDYTRQLGLPEFWKFVENLRREVWRAEFRQYDPDDTGKIKPEDFANLITDSMLGSHLPFYIVDNIRRLRTQPDRIKEEITFSVWEAFNRLMLYTPQVGRAIQTYTAAGMPLGKKDFLRAVRVVTPPEVSEGLKTQVDLIFAIFDRDGDGHLEFDEFLAVAQHKFKFNSMEHKQAREPEPFFSLLGTCWRKAREEGAIAGMQNRDLEV